MSDVDVLELVSPPDDVNVIHDFVDGALQRHPEIDLTAKLEFETAIIEVATNLVRYSHSDDPIRCLLSVAVNHDCISAEFRDQMGTFDSNLLDREMPDPLAESGRGIPLVRALVDEFSYSRANGWNTWTLRKSV